MLSAHVGPGPTPNAAHEFLGLAMSAHELSAHVFSATVWAASPRGDREVTLVKERRGRKRRGEESRERKKRKAGRGKR